MDYIIPQVRVKGAAPSAAEVVAGIVSATGSTVVFRGTGATGSTVSPVCSPVGASNRAVFPL